MNRTGVCEESFGWRDDSHARGSKYPQERRERAVRLVVESRGDRESEHAAIESLAGKLGITRKQALMDLALHGRLTLITGRAGSARELEAEKVGSELGVPLQTVVIGPGREVCDLYFDWSRLQEVEESGALPVRPDEHICWWSHELVSDPEQSLRDALNSVLARKA